MLSDMIKKYKTGIIEIEVDDMSIPICPLKEDKFSIMENRACKTEEQYQKLVDTLKKCIKQGYEKKGIQYPGDEVIDNFLVYNDNVVLLEISIAFNWIDRGALKINKVKKKELKKTSGESS